MTKEKVTDPKLSDQVIEGKALILIILADGLAAEWQILSEQDRRQRVQIQTTLYDAFHRDQDQMIYDLAFADPLDLKTNSVSFIAQISHRFIKQIALRPEREFLREKLTVDLSDAEALEIIEQAPYLIGQEFLNPEWLRWIWLRLHTVYRREIINFPGHVADYLAERRTIETPVGRVFFHLVENKNGQLPFAFLATYASGLDQNHRANHYPLKNALIEYKNEQKKMLMLLSTVNRASEQSAFIRELLESGEIYQPIALHVQEAHQFLREVPLFEESGIVCRIPDWWKARSSSPRVAVSLGAKQPSKLTLKALVDCSVKFVLGDLELSEDELRKLMNEVEGLRLIKGRWIEVDHKRLAAALKAFELLQKQIKPGGLSLVEAMNLSLTGLDQQSDTDEGNLVEVRQGDWLQTLLGQLRTTEIKDSVVPGPSFIAQLRPYQSKGLTWLHMMKSLGLGACLADDMGLGKTVQIIALLDLIRTRNPERSLLVVPASLIGNWKQEVEKFAPSLRLAVLHPSEPAVEPDQFVENCPFDLLMTTYGMLNRYAWLKEIHWDTLILDEAQAIKNPGTQQTRAAKQLQASCRIALTGTPIENSLADLWSLFDFLNKGLLGSARKFTFYTKQLQTQQAGYARLKQVVSPFILRRLKTDRSVISDLPDKIEMKTYASLSKKQTILYRQLVDSLAGQLEEAGDGIERKGLVLSTIMKLKQICNHPDQYLGQTRYSALDSGKFDRLREICETIAEKRERVLVFTQFREMTSPIQKFLESIFLHEGLVLHGGTPVAKRRKIVEAFQNTDYVPFLVMTIKAGGVGLNLTAANHVIHFDRWWNPATENQATDRAYRIGQQKHVLVHKFITSGTLEEKIDRMIEDKQGLAQDIIANQQEAWITELDDRRLIELFSLAN